jgi:hypothetical protein
MLLAATCAGCVTLPLPLPHGPLPSWATQDRGYRVQIYRRYRLSLTSVGMGTLLTREDGKHPYLDLRDVLGMYPKSRALYERAAHRDELLSTLAIWGISFAATAGFYQLAAATGDTDTLSSTGRDAFYVIGGALVGAALVGVIVWHDPIDDMPATYNEELRQDLQLDPSGE